MESLYLDDNHLGVAGARAFARALRTSRPLAVLHLGSNGVGVDGARALADALRGNGALTACWRG